MTSIEKKFKTVKDIIDAIINNVMILNEYNKETYYKDESGKILRNFVSERYLGMDFPPITQQKMSENDFEKYITDFISEQDESDLYDSKGYFTKIRGLFLSFD